MLLSNKYTYYEKLVSESCTIQEAKQIITSFPEILTFESYHHALLLDRLCMSKTSNLDIIMYVIEQSIKLKVFHNDEININSCKNDYERCKCKGGLLREKGLCMPPLKMLIFNDRIDVLHRLQQDTFILQPNDIDKFDFLHFAISHFRLEWIRYFVNLHPKSVCKTNCCGWLPIQLCANEWYKDPVVFWDTFELLLTVGIREGVGGKLGFGGLFVKLPRGNNKNIIHEHSFKSKGVSWEKMSNVVKDDLNARRVIIDQLIHGNVPKEHCKEIISNFSDVLFVKDEDGRLPIHIAAEVGLGWNDGLKEIVEANLSSIECVDAVTGLLPFTLCAIGERNDLQSVFELLRRFPNSCFVTKSR